MKYFTLFMLRDGHKNSFMSLDWALNHGGIKLEDYKAAYTGRIEPRETVTQTLEEIFTMLNISRPADYHGRSMSVSDHIDLDGKGLYFCDSIGFKKITGEEHSMNVYYKVAVEREPNATRSNIYPVCIGEKPLDYKEILRDGKCICFAGHFETQESAQRWQSLMIARKLAPIYRFPGGPSLVDDCEMIPYDERSTL